MTKSIVCLAIFVSCGTAIHGQDQSGSGDASSSNIPRYTNRLIRAKSPYLLLHAHNPVDWYPWGEEAFTKARRENKAIFLSIGYYTCHWCHVMERESFSNLEIAQLLNRWFVSIKVDREERPDLDHVYMSYVEATTGNGGWPMTVILTPDLKPFFGGTYFPPEDRNGRTGLKSLLPQFAEAWQHDQAKIRVSADRVTEQLQHLASGDISQTKTLNVSVLDTAYRELRATYDQVNGGMGGAPKFPQPVNLEFLLRYWYHAHTPAALDMITQTLHAMAYGGVHDQLGGGFHRYATDARWRVPHFEKMLYDQAQLAVIYSEAYQVTHDPFYASVARDILDFSVREMRNSKGAFYSALDADSPVKQGAPESAEGAYYVWSSTELQSILGAQLAAMFAFRYGIRDDGNVPRNQDIEGQLRGKNVLFILHSVAETAKKFATSEAEAQRMLDEATTKLLAVRSARPLPPKDTKVITAWNGLMISALATGYRAVRREEYLKAAQRAAGFLQHYLYDASTGSLQRTYRENSAEFEGSLSDYAYLVRALLDLYEADFDIRWVQWALRLQRTQDLIFQDEAGGYFMTSGRDKSVLLRTRDDPDGAEPCANGVAAINLLRLWQVTGQDAWKQKATRTLAAFGGILTKTPQEMPTLVSALESSLDRHIQIVVAGSRDAEDTLSLLQLVNDRFIPNHVLLLADGSESQRQLAQWLPSIGSMARNQGRATAYVCEGYVCKLPSSDPKVVATILDKSQ